MSPSRRRRIAWAAAAVAPFLLLTAFIALHRARAQSARMLDLEIRASGGTFAQLFWGAELAFVEERSMRIHLQPPGDGFQRLRFPLPPRTIRWIRLDPTDTAGEVLIRNMRLTDAGGQVLKTFHAADLRPASQIAWIREEGDAIRLATTPAANDPGLYGSLGCSVPFTPPEGFEYVTPAALALASLAAIALLGSCLFVIGRDAFRLGPNMETADEGNPSWRRSVPLFLVLWVAVFSARLLLMREHPVRVPFWDQWDGEALGLYVPLSECGLSWSGMFALHNEHRVFFSRLLALDLLIVNHQWDPRLQQVAGAALHSMTAALLTAMLWVGNQRRRLDLLGVLIAVSFALPFSWQNTLFGFQSAFYFLVLFSILGLWLITRYDAATVPWSLGWLCALCALVTAAGGLLLPPAMALVGVLKLGRDRRTWRGALLTLAGAALVFVIGVGIKSPPLPHHDIYRAKTVAEFAGALGHNLAWPWVGYAPASVLMWLPFVALLVILALGRAKITVLERYLIGLGVWVALQAAAIAYGRGAGAAVPDGRYHDFFSLGVIVNTVAAGLLVVNGTRLATSARRLALSGFILWLIAAAAGFNHLVDRALIELNGSQRYWNIQVENVRNVVITRDLPAFLTKRAPEIPYPDTQRLATVLQDEYIRLILPAAVREPLHITPRVVTDEAFVPEGTYPITPRDPLARAWGTYTSAGNAARGRFESEPIRCALHGYLQVDVAGYLRMRRESLVVRDLRSSDRTQIAPPVSPKEDWLSVTIPCPTNSFVIVAEDARSDYWFSFREPVEVGRLSLAAEWLIAASPALLLGIFVLAVLLPPPQHHGLV